MPERGRRRGVSAELARDYIYHRLEGLSQIIHSGDAAARDAAKWERDFLEKQLVRAHVEGRGTVVLDASLEEIIREKTVRGKISVDVGGRGGESPVEMSVGASDDERFARAPYRAMCEKMSFLRLLEFIDENLRRLPMSEKVSETNSHSPRTKEEFVALLALLRAKAGGRALSSGGSGPLSGVRPERTPFVPSDELRELRAEHDRVAALHANTVRDRTSHDRVVRLLARRKIALEKQAATLEAQERRTHELEHSARLRSYEQAKARARALAEEVRRHPRGKDASSGGARKEGRKDLDAGLKVRLKEVERVRRDIERAFRWPAGFSTKHKHGRARKLPWRLLPPGHLTREKVMSHYERLGQARPDVRFDPQRIEKAWSLGPAECYIGEDEFNGYVVFTYPNTSRALLECPVYGHAIYVLGPDWKRLSRLSKRELLSDRTSGVTKIVHKGNWFARTKAALGIR